jgi:hypothetical protein
LTFCGWTRFFLPLHQQCGLWWGCRLLAWWGPPFCWRLKTIGKSLICQLKTGYGLTPPRCCRIGKNDHSEGCWCCIRRDRRGRTKFCLKFTRVIVFINQPSFRLDKLIHNNDRIKMLRFAQQI